MKKQFVQVPTINLKEIGLKMKDLVVYAYLKKHYNHTTKEAYPSYDTLAKESGISKPTIIKCIERLKEKGYINYRKANRRIYYTFSESNKFEIYSFDFLDDKSLSTNDKAYIISMQPYMWKNEQLGIGKVVFSDLEIANKLNIDLRTLKNYEKHLQEQDKNILTFIPSKKVDPDTGLIINERLFNFEAYNNLIALKFMQVDEKLEDTVSKKDFFRLLNRVNELEKLLKTEEITKNVIHL